MMYLKHKTQYSSVPKLLLKGFYAIMYSSFNPNNDSLNWKSIVLTKNYNKQKFFLHPTTQRLSLYG